MSSKNVSKNVLSPFEVTIEKDCVIICWKCREGDAILEGNPLVEVSYVIEGKKMVVCLFAPKSGYITKFFAKERDSVSKYNPKVFPVFFLTSKGGKLLPRLSFVRIMLSLKNFAPFAERMFLI